MIPLLFSRLLWQTGIGGSIPSMLAYVFSVAGIFQLVRTVLPDLRDPITRFAAWLAAVIFVLNPNLIYLQTTAMTEPLYLAFFIWATVFFSDFIRHAAEPANANPNSSLTK